MILRFFFFPRNSDQNNLQLGPPCSLIFCNLFFLFFFFSFLITFFTCLLFSLYVFQHSLTASPLLLACLSRLQASFLVWIASSISFDHQSLDNSEILFLPIPLSAADITFVFHSPHTLSTSSSPTSLISTSLTQASHPWNSSSIASWNSSQLLFPSTLHLNLSPSIPVCDFLLSSANMCIEVPHHHHFVPQSTPFQQISSYLFKLYFSFFTPNTLRICIDHSNSYLPLIFQFYFYPKNPFGLIL